MQIAHKIELKCNNKHRTYFKQACGVRRHAYNWGLIEWNKIYESNKKIENKSDREKISAMELKKKYNSIRKKEFPWSYDVSKYASANAFWDLQDSFSRFFKKQNAYPQKKKKGKSRDSFSIGGDQIKVAGKKIKIPNLGWIKLTEEIRFKNIDGSPAKINGVTISRTADKWFASIQIAVDDEVAAKMYPSPLKEKTLGVDIGITSIIVTSDGLDFKADAPLRKKLRKLKRENRRLAKKYLSAKKEKREIKNSANFQKQKNKVARIHATIANKRKDVLHKITTFITSEYSSIAIEDLKVKNMVKNHKLALSVLDVGFGELRRQMIYKTEMRQTYLKLVDPFFPSTKMCRICKLKKKEMKLSERIFICDDPFCGHTENRDLNAARNLENQLFVVDLKTKVSKEKTVIKKDLVGRASPEFTPVEITALQHRVRPVVVTSIEKREAGNKHQKLCG